MPLIDHFHMGEQHPVTWEGFHSAWATHIANRLNEYWLRPDFLASEHTHVGPRVEIDVAAFERPTVTTAPVAGNGSVATIPLTWTVPTTTCTIPALFPDSFEVLLHLNNGGWSLVGAIELIGPGNKDRATNRQAFASKCASYLLEGVSVVLIDIVTKYRANLHNEVVAMLNAPDTARFQEEVGLYASALRPVTRSGRAEIEIWMEPCVLGDPLPIMPLRLVHELFVPVEFEESYTETCRRRGLV